MAADYDLVFAPQFLADLSHWVRAEPRVAARVLQLCQETGRDPYAGIGKPERLKHRLSGLWSRRITAEHRLVYEVTSTAVRFVSCRYHYADR